MTIAKVTRWMVDNGYFMVHRGHYVVTRKFNEEVRNVKEGIVKLPNGQTVVAERNKPEPGLTPEQWRDLYLKFIVDTKVPKYVKMSNGGVYRADTYNEQAMKQFRNILEKEGVDLERLTKVTTQYYSNPNAILKTMTNFITEGIWRTMYQQQGLKEDYDYDFDTD